MDWAGAQAKPPLETPMPLNLQTQMQNRGGFESQYQRPQTRLTRLRRHVQGLVNQSRTGPWLFSVTSTSSSIRSAKSSADPNISIK